MINNNVYRSNKIMFYKKETSEPPNPPSEISKEEVAMNVIFIFNSLNT